MSRLGVLAQLVRALPYKGSALLQVMVMSDLTSKQKGAIAELAIAQDLASRGYAVALPFGEFGVWDLLVERKVGPSPPRNTIIQKVQVKYAQAKNGYIPVRNRCHSVHSGKVTKTYHYNELVDWFAVYEPISRQCYYIPVTQLAGGEIRLRLEAPKNNQAQYIAWAKDYQDI